MVGRFHPFPTSKRRRGNGDYIRMFKIEEILHVFVDLLDTDRRGESD